MSMAEVERLRSGKSSVPIGGRLQRFYMAVDIGEIFVNFEARMLILCERVSASSSADVIKVLVGRRGAP